MIEVSYSLKLNEIHTVDSPFNEDPKNIIFFQGGPNFGGGMALKFRKMGSSKDIYCYANRGWSVLKENISLYSLVPKSLSCLNVPTYQTKF